MEVNEVEITSLTIPQRAKGGGKKRGYKYSNSPSGLLDKLQALLEDEDYINLREECALARAILDGMLQADKEWEDMVLDIPIEKQMEKGLNKPPYPPGELLKALRAVSNLVEKEYKIKFGDANLITIDAAIGFAL